MAQLAVQIAAYKFNVKLKDKQLEAVLKFMDGNADIARVFKFSSTCIYLYFKILLVYVLVFTLKLSCIYIYHSHLDEVVSNGKKSFLITHLHCYFCVSDLLGTSMFYTRR